MNATSPTANDFPRQLSADTLMPDLHQFLSEEISAGQAYRLAASQEGDEGAAYACRGILLQIQEEHELAAEVLRQFEEESGEPFDDRSGSWGSWSAAIHRCQNAGGTMPEAPTLFDCLLEGEQRLLELFLTRSAGLSGSAAEFVSGQLIPAQQRHVRMLRLLLGDVPTL